MTLRLNFKDESRDCNKYKMSKGNNKGEIHDRRVKNKYLSHTHIINDLILFFL